LKKKILIISYYWPPAGGPGVQRWLKFAKYLPEFNISPVLFVPENANYPINDNSLKSEVSKDLEIIKLPIFELSNFFPSLKSLNSIRSGNISKNKNQSILQKVVFFIRGNFFIPDMKIFWKRNSVNFLKNYLSENNIETIITTGPPHSIHLIGLELKRKLNINWISDFRDPWVNLNYLNRFHLLPFVKEYHKKLRDKVINNSDAVIVTSKRLKDLYSEINSSIFQVTNGYDYNKPVIKLDKKFSISHVGSLYNERNPEFLWDIIDELSENLQGFKEDLQINLIGNNNKKIKQNLSKRVFNDCVVCYDYVEHKKAIEFMCSSQVLLMLEVDDDESSYAIPGKLFDYLNSNRPIISIGPEQSEVREILSNTGSGKFFNYKDYNSLKLYIEKLYENYVNNLSISDNNYNIDNYNRKNLTSKLVEVINKIGLKK
tara:strand:- start:181 stop:1470 length:1290 start_codon:yes stop_codon:yes gene_type:complete